MESSPPSIPEPTDEYLVTRVAQRDSGAFALLYDRYARMVYVMAVHMLSRTEAEETVQDIFLRLWNHATQYDAVRGSFRVWFMAVARHRILDELKRRGEEAHNVIEVVEQILAEVVDQSVDLEGMVASKEQTECVLRALQTLPEEQRRVIVLGYFGGFSQSEMAQQLQIPLGTVKKRVRLGLQKLRAALNESKTQL